jgi:hypothetical protein
LRPDLPEAFVRVGERALANDPKGRYPTAGALADELAASVGFSYAETSDEKGANRRPRSKARLARYWLLAAGIVLLTSTIAGGLWWNSTSAARRLEIGAKFHLMKASKGSVLRSGDRVAPGDMLFLTIESSKPVYVYVINQDEQGESYLMFPLPGMNVANPLPGGVNRMPGARGGEEFYWQVSSVGGREHFYIFASRYELEQFEDSIKSLPRPKLDTPVTSIHLPRELVGKLRGVGGLVKTDATTTTASTTGFPVATPLLETPETARGFWAREIVFANPAK